MTSHESAMVARKPGARKPPRRRRWLRRLLILIIVLAALVAAAGFAFRPLGRWYIKDKVLPRIAARLALSITVDRVELDFQRVRLWGVKIRPEDRAHGSQIELHLVAPYRLYDLLRGKVVVPEVAISIAKLSLQRRKDGHTGFEAILARLGARSKGRAPGTGSGRRFQVGRIHFVTPAMTLDDQKTGVSLAAARVEGRWRAGADAKVSVSEVAISLPLATPKKVSFGQVVARIDRQRRIHLTVKGGDLRLLSHLRLSGIDGTIEPNIKDKTVALSLSGSYGGATARLWAAEGRVEPLARSGQLKLKAARFSLDRVRGILASTPIMRPERASVDGRLSLRYAAGKLGFSGELAVSGLALFHPALARQAINNLSAKVVVKGLAQRRRIDLHELRLSVRDVVLSLRGFVDRLDTRPLIDLRLQMPEVKCQQILDSIPPVLVPKLAGFKLRGKLLADLRLVVDYENLDKLELGGKLPIRRCKVLKTPVEASARRLEGPFEHSVEVRPGQWKSFVVGPENPHYTPYQAIAPILINALLTTEDGGFFRHRGFIRSQFRTALSRNLKRGGFRLGASTITMQMVKNVLLSHEKTLSRKLQELILTWYVEQHLSKERLMEIYLNAIEFGPGIFGIGHASRHYFNKPPIEITPLEAAFFATILPSPKRRYVQYCRGELSERWDRYVRRVLKTMHARGRASEEHLKEAEKQTLVFHRDLVEFPVKECIKTIETLTESWNDAYWERLEKAVKTAAPHQLKMHIKSVEQRRKERRQRARKWRRQG